MGMMTTYKPGQGRQARTLATVLYVLVVAWGCYALFEYGNSKLDRLLGNDSPVFANSLLDGSSSLTAWITPSFVLASLVFIGLVLWGRGFFNRPKMGDLLIGTELEMRRVKWPTRAEVGRAGSMVVFYVFWLALIIFVIDLLAATGVGMLLGRDFSEVGIGRILSGIFGFFGGGA